MPKLRPRSSVTHLKRCTGWSNAGHWAQNVLVWLWFCRVEPLSNFATLLGIGFGHVELGGFRTKKYSTSRRVPDHATSAKTSTHNG